MSNPLPFLSLVLLCACVPPPEYLAVIEEEPVDGPAPELLPIDDVLATVARAETVAEPDEEVAALEARAAALQARAAALTAEEVIDETTRETMGGALERRTDPQ